jgi:hypothetical protein
VLDIRIVQFELIEQLANGLFGLGGFDFVAAF